MHTAPGSASTPSPSAVSGRSRISDRRISCTSKWPSCETGRSPQFSHYLDSWFDTHHVGPRQIVAETKYLIIKFAQRRINFSLISRAKSSVSVWRGSICRDRLKRAGSVDASASSADGSLRRAPTAPGVRSRCGPATVVHALARIPQRADCPRYLASARMRPNSR